MQLSSSGRRRGLSDLQRYSSEQPRLTHIAVRLFGGWPAQMLLGPELSTTWGCPVLTC